MSPKMEGVRPRDEVTAAQRRELLRLKAKLERQEAEVVKARRAIEAYCRNDPTISIPAAARVLGISPQALHKRVNRKR